MAAAGDGFRAIGLPILLILITIFSIAQFKTLVLSRSPLTLSKLDLKMKFTLVSSLAQIILSVFLFFSFAWNFGVVILFTSLVVIRSLCERDASTETLQKWTFIGLVAVNAQVLTGFWNGADLFTAIDARCDTWFGSYSDSMCVKGWIAALQFFGVLIVGGLFWNCFAFFLVMIEDKGTHVTESQPIQHTTAKTPPMSSIPETVSPSYSVGGGYQSVAYGRSEP